ncbi:hypothetical protein [uncultured Methylobacterium sp.]|uniref:hypothetical protein n=1 Tax=uncultured Methylobacterium sp. TaxID=157278 RepID=UPI0035CC26A9
MSSDQVAKLAATIEVLSGAVRFLLAERVSRQPEAVQDDLLQVLQRSLSKPARTDGPLPGTAASVQAGSDLWVPLVATSMLDAVRRQLGRTTVAATPVAPQRARAISETFSEMAERARREDPRGTGLRPEDRRSAA